PGHLVTQLAGLDLAERPGGFLVAGGGLRQESGEPHATELGGFSRELRGLGGPLSLHPALEVGEGAASLPRVERIQHHRDLPSSSGSSSPPISSQNATSRAALLVLACVRRSRFACAGSRSSSTSTYARSRRAASTQTRKPRSISRASASSPSAVFTARARS